MELLPLTVSISCLSVLHYKSCGIPDSGGKNKEEERAEICTPYLDLEK